MAQRKTVEHKCENFICRATVTSGKPGDIGKKVPVCLICNRDMTGHCIHGFGDLHRQLYEGHNAPETRYWLKHILFNCHYAVTPCGYQYGE